MKWKKKHLTYGLCLPAVCRYHEIQRLDRLGFSKNRIAKYLKVNWRTVRKYFNMTEEGFEQFLLQKGNKDKILDPYKDFVLSRLQAYSDTTGVRQKAD